jgi:hypothetical protein
MTVPAGTKLGPYEITDAIGKRFLVNARVQGPESPPLNVVVNWTAEHNLQ